MKLHKAGLIAYANLVILLYRERSRCFKENKAVFSRLAWSGVELIAENYRHIHLLGLDLPDLGFASLFFYVFIWEINLKGLNLCLIRLEACVADIAHLEVRAIGHGIAAAVCGLCHVDLRALEYLFPILCFSGHIQDQPLWGWSAVRYSVTGLIGHADLNNSLWYRVTRFQ